jgi:hypothetical protein
MIVNGVGGVTVHDPANLRRVFEWKFGKPAFEIPAFGKAANAGGCLAALSEAAALVDDYEVAVTRYMNAIATGAKHTEFGIKAAALVLSAVATAGVSAGGITGELGISASGGLTTGGKMVIAAEGAVATEGTNLMLDDNVTADDLKQSIFNVLAATASAGAGGTAKDKLDGLWKMFAPSVISSVSKDLIKLAGKAEDIDDFVNQAGVVLAKAAGKGVASGLAGAVDADLPGPIVGTATSTAMLGVK